MSPPEFIDLFSGCGGFSLGLSLAGLQGRFAIERDSMAFETFSANMLGNRAVPVTKFLWPEWLKQKAWSIDDLLAAHLDDLTKLQGQVQVIAGGPPCQGFSFAGRRMESDPRNLLFEKYVQVVDAIRPSILILENVPGMKVAHTRKLVVETSHDNLVAPPKSFYEKLKQSLDEIGYAVHGKILDASLFGVPQKRSRLIVIGIKKELANQLEGGAMYAFSLIENFRRQQLIQLDLPSAVSAKDALSDLETSHQKLQPFVDVASRKGFSELAYQQPLTNFQRLMHSGGEGTPMDSMRMARHRDDVRGRFQRILDECPKGTNMSLADRAKYGLNKHRNYLMSPDFPAPTVTTLPDDILHYSEPRILTVRETARLQTFPDWFHFRGKFTTGGKKRTKECPRYTQVGNAVPPFLAKVIGLAVKSILDEANARRHDHDEKDLISDLATVERLVSTPLMMVKAA